MKISLEVFEEPVLYDVAQVVVLENQGCDPQLLLVRVLQIPVNTYWLGYL